jgi:N-glycosylase/DNA lyase
MNLAAINSAIQTLCEEMSTSPLDSKSWNNADEDELLYEMAFCIFGSQMLYEVTVAAVDKLKDNGLLSHGKARVFLQNSAYSDEVRKILSESLTVKIRGMERRINLRFSNRLSNLLAETLEKIYGAGLTIKQLLISAHSGRNARKLFVHYVVGFGPKQASLFLRRVGYCSELAVLDTHIMDYLKLANGTEIKPNALSRLPSYERVEDEFLIIANEFGYSAGCVDLAMWVSMRVAKRGFAA